MAATPFLSSLSPDFGGFGSLGPVEIDYNGICRQQLLDLITEAAKTEDFETKDKLLFILNDIANDQWQRALYFALDLICVKKDTYFPALRNGKPLLSALEQTIIPPTPCKMIAKQQRQWDAVLSNPNISALIPTIYALARTKQRACYLLVFASETSLVDVRTALSEEIELDHFSWNYQTVITRPPLQWVSETSKGDGYSFTRIIINKLNTATRWIVDYITKA